MSNSIPRFTRLTTDVKLEWLTKYCGEEWHGWQKIAAQWFTRQNIEKEHYKKKQLGALGHFFRYLVGQASYASDVNLFFSGVDGHVCSAGEFEGQMSLTIKSKQTIVGNSLIIVDFLDHVSFERSKDRSDTTIKHPFADRRPKSTRHTKDFRWLTLQHGIAWEEWRSYVEGWLKVARDSGANAGESNRQYALIVFFRDYVLTDLPYASKVELFFEEYHGKKPSTSDFLRSVNKGQSKSALRQVKAQIPVISEFISFVIEKEFGVDARKIENPIKTWADENIIGYSTDQTFSWLIRLHGKQWEEWQSILSTWIKSQGAIAAKLLTMKAFFEDYLIKYHEYANDPVLLFKGNGSQQVSRDGLLDCGLFCNQKEDVRRRSIDVICDMLTFASGVRYVEKDFESPMESYRTKSQYRRGIKDLRWVTDQYGDKWRRWEEHGSQWLKSIRDEPKYGAKMRGVGFFIEYYLIDYLVDCAEPERFFQSPKARGAMLGKMLDQGLRYSKEGIRDMQNNLHDFINYVIINYYEERGFENPIERISKKLRNYSSDFDYEWLTEEYGKSWQPWQDLAAEWAKGQVANAGRRVEGVSVFLRWYLIPEVAYAVDVDLFFKGYNGHIASNEEVLTAWIRHSPISKVNHLKYNYAVKFLDDVIANHYSEKDEFGVMRPSVQNPLSEIKAISPRTNETVRQALPYRYILQLREILISSRQHPTEKASSSNSWDSRNFEDWSWASNAISTRTCWFEVDKEHIDENDPDCVWKEDTVNRGFNNVRKVYKMWCPATAVALFVKLHLPLRGTQIRFLDSGEADTWRYEAGDWVENTRDLARGTTKSPVSKGVFDRIYDPISESYGTGLYVTTNKTTDRNQEIIDRGYRIPWQHEELLYWLEKLRDWQEKYNAIDSPIAATRLGRQDFTSVKSEVQKENMGEFCFLFRNACAWRNKNSVEPQKPIHGDHIERLWHVLLNQLQDHVHASGQTMSDGSPLQFVEKNPNASNGTRKYTTPFVLHSLRVSLITSYALDSSLPLPVISKLLAGHARLLMTIYYVKLTPSVMAAKMASAEQELLEQSDRSLESFLENSDIEQVKSKCASPLWRHAEMALKNRNPIPWERRGLGICLAGGNTSFQDMNRSIGGCWNGDIESRPDNEREFPPVPHGPENCVRCRWYVTDASHLPVLNAHFNQLSYKAHMAANEAAKINSQLEVLKDQEYIARKEGRPFTEHEQIKSLSRRHESQSTEADEFTKDYIATFRIIEQLMILERNRAKDDDKHKLVALGSHDDLAASLKFVETDSELLQLSLLCEDAEVYPDLLDKLKKTPAIERRNGAISRVMTKAGYEPVLMDMDDNMRFVAANTLMRCIASISNKQDKFEGYRIAANYIDTEQYLQDSRLLVAGFNALDDKCKLQKLTIKPTLNHGS